VYVSDDMEWGRKNIKSKNNDVFFVGKTVKFATNSKSMEN